MKSLITILLVTVFLASKNAAAGEVQTLTSTNFQEALNDPANGIWLLKFYAPWCSQ